MINLDLRLKQNKIDHTNLKSVIYLILKNNCYICLVSTPVNVIRTSIAGLLFRQIIMTNKVSLQTMPHLNHL